MKRCLFAIAAGFLVVAADAEEGGVESPSVESPVAAEDPVVVAKAAAAEAFGKLSAVLSAEISGKGVAAAIAVCSEKAPEILAKISREKGVVMARASERNRNPGNHAGTEDRKALADFLASLEEGKPAAAQVERQADGAAVVRLPIVINSELCLKCHGMVDEIEAATLAAIRKEYPDDRATGYQAGDLRGLWRISIPAGGAGEAEDRQGLAD
ncbi:MAG: Tll0287-like domain-containing protein [Verrucomicrobiales bacterium]